MPKTSPRGRFDRRDSLTFVAMDTVDPLIDHVLGIFGEGREMTKIQRYRSNIGPNASALERHDWGLASLDIKTGLTLADQAEYLCPVIDRWTQSRPVGKGLHILLGNFMSEGFGFGAYERDAPTEEKVREKYRAAKPDDVFARCRNLTVVRTTGWPGEPSHEDRIEIEYWNEHGVCSDVVIAFSR